MPYCDIMKPLHRSTPRSPGNYCEFNPNQVSSPKGEGSPKTTKLGNRTTQGCYRIPLFAPACRPACPNKRAYNGKQQHTKNRATQLHDNTVGSPAGASQLECKLWCWNCGSRALLAHETHKMLCNPGHLYSGSAATKNPCTSPHC